MLLEMMSSLGGFGEIETMAMFPKVKNETGEPFYFVQKSRNQG